MFLRKTFLISLFLAIITPCAFYALFSNTGYSQETDKTKGVVTYVEGAARKQKVLDSDWTNVAQNSQVEGGDRVRTLTESRAELELATLDKIRMAPKTTINILKLFEESKEQVREAKIVLQSGDLWANVTKKSSDLKFSIGTPVAVAAITGTVLRMNVDTDSSAELRVYTGEVIISNATDPASVKAKSIQPYEIQGPHEVPGPHEVSLEQWALIVKSMQKVKVGKNGQVLGSGDFADSDQDEQSEWVKWNLTRDKGEQ